MRRIALILVILSLLTVALAAQSDTTSGSSQKLTLKEEKQRTPMGALLRSLAVPGWGQFYNRSYIKATIVFGAETFFIYKAAHWWIETEDQYDRVEQATPEMKSFEFQLYQSYRGRRNDFLWLTGLTIFLSIFDAYVDAHLSGFDIDLTPDFQNSDGDAKLTLTVRF